MIKYPITVNKITFEGDAIYSQGWRKGSVGKFVSIRPCAPECEGKTYLGIYLGEFAVSVSAEYKEQDKELIINRAMANPAMFVFDLNRVIFGYESWWGIVKNEDELRRITDFDIENIWYVKALKSLRDG